MFVKLGGKFLTVAGKFATSLACCCGYNKDKWKCLLSSDGSYRCDTEYDFEQDQLLSEHSSKEDCERFCGQDQVYCYYDAKIGYYCTDYFDEGYLSGPYPDTITCNEACKQMWFCVDKGTGGGETQYECTLQDPSEDYLSGPYGSKEACEYRCGNQWWCTYKYINTDEYEYECVQDNTGEPDNAVSGPYMSKVECDTYCEICEEIILPEQKPCPDCVDDACVYLAGEGGIDGGQWGTCCAGLIETWRYCNGDWELILPCHPRETRTAGTPACEVYPEKLDFPDNPSEGQLYDVECDRVLDFDPSDYPDCEDCDYNCVDNNGAYECELDPAGPHKTLQDCIDKCPEKWGCIATDECVQKPDGTYLTETECVENAPVDCAGPYPTGRCCLYPYTSSGPQPAGTAEEAIQLASQSAEANSSAVEGSIWTVGYFANGKFFENQALFDEARNQWTCVGFWTTGFPASCSVSTEDQCGVDQPFAFWAGGLTCDDDCPENPPQPQPAGVCLYREDGLGTCTEYVLNGDGNGGYATQAEAQAAGNVACQSPDAPECYECRADVQLEADETWGYTLTFREFAYDENGEVTGCEKTSYETTEIACGGGDPLADATWEKNLPATHCRAAGSADECTESTGVFCPDLTECPDNPSEGCPETPIRNLPTFNPPP